ncbi:uncharacterized protein J3D65DRAFT_637203, partial [Phyllosticta citribraziliensis]
MSSLFPQLPEELKDLILGQTDVPTLQSMRLVSQSFGLTTSRHLFREVKVDVLDPDSIRALSGIAANPALALCIKELVAVTGVGRFTRASAPDCKDKRNCILLNLYLATFDDPDGFQASNPILPTLRALFRAIRELRNLERVSSVLREGSMGWGDPSMDIILLALTQRMHCFPARWFRTIQSVRWAHASGRSFNNIWRYQEEQRRRRTEGDAHGKSSSIKILPPPASFFSMLKHLDLRDVQPGEKYDEHCDNRSLACLCSHRENALESLHLDCGIDSCSANDFHRRDSLKPFQGFALSPNLSKVRLSRLITSTDSLLAFVGRVAGTLRDLSLDYVLLSPYQDCSGDAFTEYAGEWWEDDDGERVFPQSDQTWEKLMAQLRDTFSSTAANTSSSSSSKKPPLLSLHMRRLIDSVGVTSEGWDHDCVGRILLDTYSSDDDDNDADDAPGAGWFARHHFNFVRDYLLGRQTTAVPLQASLFAEWHARQQQAGCPLCEQLLRSSLDFSVPDDERIGVDSSLEDVRQVLSLWWDAGLSDEGVVFRL